MTIDRYQQLAQALEQGPAVLATVVSVKGSTPREVGAKMILCADGRTFNTIGGGAGEAKVIQQAMTVLATGEKQFAWIDLSGAPQRETQGICGGTMQVWLERWSGEAAIALVKQILDLLQSGQTATLVTPFAPEKLPYLLPQAAAIPDLTHAFIETIQPPPTLLIIGAGHVGEQLAKVASLIGFQIAIQDDRSLWANTERYPQASIVFNTSIASTVAQLASCSQLYAALVTRSYHYDLEALEVLLKRQPPCLYIGAIGSEKRVRQVYQALETSIPQSQLRSLYAPIGLDIGAMTPAEIAVSICAELILVCRGGTGRSLSQLRQGQNLRSQAQPENE